MARDYRFYVYMMQSSSRRTLYIGMTNNLYRRVFQHKTHEFRGFTYDYDAVRLVYWESFDDVQKAITREKQFKNWRREKKDWLIQRANPGWKDLAADWYRKPSSAVSPNSATTLSSRAQRSGVEGPCVSTPARSSISKKAS